MCSTIGGVPHKPALQTVAQPPRALASPAVTGSLVVLSLAPSKDESFFLSGVGAQGLREKGKVTGSKVREQHPGPQLACECGEPLQPHWVACPLCQRTVQKGEVPVRLPVQATKQSKSVPGAQPLNKIVGPSTNRESKSVPKAQPPKKRKDPPANPSSKKHSPRTPKNQISQPAKHQEESNSKAVPPKYKGPPKNKVNTKAALQKSPKAPLVPISQSSDPPKT